MPDREEERISRVGGRSVEVETSKRRQQVVGTGGK